MWFWGRTTYYYQVIIEWLQACMSCMSESTQTSQADLCDVKRCSLKPFFPKTTEKRLDKQAQKFTPLPPAPQNDVKRFLAVFCRVSWDFAYLVYPNSAFFRGNGANWGGGGGGGGQLAKFGWILTYSKISLEMAVTRFLPGAIQF